MSVITEELRSRNFSIYGQWTGVICIILCLAVGIANIFSFNAILIVFSVLCIVSGCILIFTEVPFLLRICPTSEKFDTFIRRFTTNWMRAAMYTVMSVVQWLSLLERGSSLLAAAVFLLIAGLFYALAGLKSQEFVGSKTLGGQGIAQMIV
ncbi:Tvp18 family protein [Aspergillus undulatus]|uniref:Tvp18 family protein n=1 Tax=Aspergillus undulatus TaxID=1810928 RepID=UPI003CCDECC3